MSDRLRFTVPAWKSRDAMLALACAWVGGLAHSATYFVDASLGSDSLSGQSATVAGAAGPWRTLAKVSAAALLPGDSVLLRCGQVWSETLALQRSGSLGQPITIGSFPSPSCSDKPTIDGSSTLTSDAWERHSGNIYRTLLPGNVLPQGQLTTSVSGWRVYSGTADIRVALAVTCPQPPLGGCAAVTTGRNGGIAISPAFAMVPGQRYKVSLQVLAPAGQAYGAAVRRFSNLTQISGYAAAVGNGAWQTLSFSFTGNAVANDGRVDIDVPGNGQTTYLRQVRVAADQPAPADVLDALAAASAITGPSVLTLAHHPNVGYNSARPSSMLLSTAVSSVVKDPLTGRTGADYVATGTDLVLPPGASLTPGLGVRVRSQTWSWTQHTVTAVSANRLYVAPITPYPLNYPGWGYQLTGALWMLDSPGEWFYDQASGYAYVWMPDGGAPGSRVSLTTLPAAVQIGNPTIGVFPRYIVLDNLAMRRAGTAVNMARMTNITLKSLDIQDIAGHAVVAEGAHFLTLQNSRFANLLSDAVYATSANDTVISGNTILNNGVQLTAAGNVATLPRESFEAIQVGARALIGNNRITNAAYIGILAGNDSTIENNVLQNYGLVLNDGGGIYGAGATHLTIRNNLVLNGVGNTDGVPSIMSSLMAGLYADGNAGNFTISGNTFSGADYCLQLHDAYNSLIENNTCFGARRAVIRMQETNSNRSQFGDVYGNVVRGNRLFNTSTGPTLQLASKVNDVSDFGGFDYNSYSTLVSPIITKESWPSVSRAFDLPDWRASALQGELTEPHGTVAAPLSRYARDLMGAAVTLAKGEDGTISGWGALTTGSAMTAGLTCGPTGGPCNNLIAPSASASTFYMPRFAVTKGKRYRVSFDARVTDAAQVLMLSLIRGSAPYDSLAGLEAYVFSAKTAWTRYAFTFQAASDATNARIDLNNVAANVTISIANYQVVEVAGGSLELRSDLLVNSSDVAVNQACPATGSRAQDCSKFFRFPEGTRVSWPISLAARSSQIVFTQDDSLPDADGDGIADSQDACPGTAPGAVVNDRGCALGQ